MDITKLDVELEAKDVLPNKPHAGLQNGRKMPFLSLETLTFDLDIQTRPSEGPDTSFLWIWRKAGQQFQRYFIHKQSHRWRQKQNLTQFTACGKDHHRKARAPT